MSQVHPIASSSSSSCFNFQSVFNAALEAYEKKTKCKLISHPLTVQLQSCDSPTAILSVLQDVIQQFDHRRSSDERLTNWLNPTVNVLYVFSDIIGQSVGLVLSPANVVFSGIGILLIAAKDVDANYDVLIDIFVRIEGFFMRLESYTEVPPTAAMTDVIVKIMIEILSILAIVTEEIRQGRSKKFVKKLLGRNDIEGALKQLDTLTMEEARMAIVETRMVTAETLNVTHKVDDKVSVLIDGIQRLANIADEEKQSQLRAKLQNWLSPPDPSTNHNMARKAHYKGTTSWFFQGGIFEEWKQSSSLLWVHGKPGSGKSVLCSRIIEDIIAEREAGSAIITYFYCDFRDDDKQSCRNLVLSIISQLCAQSKICCDTLSRIYTAHNEGAQKPSEETLTRCLTEIVSLPLQVPIYIIVDALDVCPNDSGLPTPREEVLDLFKNLVSLRIPNLHICVTSRPEIDIQSALKPLTSLCVSLHNESGQKKDIVDYISSVVCSDTKMRRWREEDRNLVIDTLTEKANGMFLWVYCQLEALRHCLPPSLRGILNELPDTLEEIYERALKEINKANREHALRLLQCLTVAARPLRVEELAEVLAIDFAAPAHGGIPQLNPTWRWTDHHRAVLSTCSSLITIVDDRGFQVVHFSHFSVKEFLTSDRLALSSRDVSRYHIDLEAAHTILGKVCLGVLLQVQYDVEGCTPEDRPLARYAAEHWTTHAQFGEASSRLHKGMEYLFDANKPHFKVWLALYDIDTESGYDATFYEFAPRRKSLAGPLYYAALCGFYDLVEHLITKHPQDVNAYGGYYVRPLVAALAGEHFQTADLLRHNGADQDDRGVYGRNPLHAAAFSGNFEMIQKLIEYDSADINVRDRIGWTPLLWASRSPHFKDGSVLRLLLEHGADINSQNQIGWTPLHLASFNGALEVVRLLVEHGADVEAKDKKGKTALQVAAGRRHNRIVKLLREHRAK